MGISGLIPFLKKASRVVNVADFKGATVAIDSYCWLHKGAFSCAEKLALGEKTDQYVYYCMKFVRMLLKYGLKPIMVFDGCRLPAKKHVEKERREKRDVHRKKAAQLLREGKRAEARDALTKCIDISPQMALELMKACRDEGVDCIVAPYDADSQLAYLSLTGVADIIITEDSDLVLFGCERVLFKMDIAGNGMLVEHSLLHKAMDLREDVYSFSKFRYMAILSGCDYLASLPGIGLKKAEKIFKLTRQDNMELVLKKLPITLNMPNLQVGPDYIEGFFQAVNTFLHQLVYDPLKRKLLPLNPYPPEIDPSEMAYAGPYIPDDKAFQIAVGNIDINTGKYIYDFDPDTFKPKASWSYNPDSEWRLISIWSSKYVCKKWVPLVNYQAAGTPSQKNAVVNSTKHVVASAHYEESLSDTDIISSYGDGSAYQFSEKVSEHEEPPLKRQRTDPSVCDGRDNIHHISNKQRSDSIASPDLSLFRHNNDKNKQMPITEKKTTFDITKSRLYLETLENKSDEHLPEILSPERSYSKCESKENILSPQKRVFENEKSPRNTFAVKNTTKQRFNLDKKKDTDVKSRFFKLDKPLPKTSFFHKMAGDDVETLYNDVEILEDDDVETLGNDIKNESAHSETFDKEEDISQSDFSLKVNAKKRHCDITPHNRFAFKQSSLKVLCGNSSPLPQTDGVKQQFKPVKIEATDQSPLNDKNLPNLYTRADKPTEDPTPSLPSLPQLSDINSGVFSPGRCPTSQSGSTRTHSQTLSMDVDTSSHSNQYSINSKSSVLPSIKSEKADSHIGSLITMKNVDDIPEVVSKTLDNIKHSQSMVLEGSESVGKRKSNDGSLLSNIQFKPSKSCRQTGLSKNKNTIKSSKITSFFTNTPVKSQYFDNSGK